METTIVYWGYMGTMENEMETSIVLGLYWPPHEKRPHRDGAQCFESTVWG